MCDSLQWQHWGRIGYGEALQRQEFWWQSVQDGASSAVFTLEHDPVITLGKRAAPEHLLVDRTGLSARGVEVFDVDRGGEATYHGPGQLVVYAIINIKKHGIGVGDLVRNLAGAIMDRLASDGLTVRYDPERPGLWTEHDAKITAVGMRISRGVSRHGAALNVTTDLDAFRLIVPCGMPTARTTSMAAEGLRSSEMPALGEEIAIHLARRLGFTLTAFESEWPSA